MKSEPDRMDILIVLLPVVLLAVFAFQVYRFVETRHDRTPGSEIVAEVSALIASSPRTDAAPAAPGSGSPGSAPSPAAGPATDPAAGAAEEPEGTAGEAGTGSIEPAGGAVVGESADPAGPPSPGEEPEAVPGGEPADGAGTPGGGDAPTNRVASPGGGLPSPSEPIAAFGEEAGPSGTPPAFPGGGTPPAGEASPAGGTGVPVILAPATADDTPAPAAAAEEPVSQTPYSGGGAALPDDSPADEEDPGSVNPEKPAQVNAVPPSATVKVGDIVPVEVRIQNGINVANVPFHLSFNPDVLKLNDSPSGIRGPFLVRPGYTTQFLVAPGPGGGEAVVGLSLMGSPEGVRGAGVLGTIYLQAIAPGTSLLRFTSASVRGPDARPLPAQFLSSGITVEE